MHRVPPVLSPSDWCERYDIPVVDGVVTLYKYVNSDFKSFRGGDYTPGTIPVASDWDGGKQECGGGLHFCPTPGHARGYQNGAKYVACPVSLADIAVHPDPQYPDKIKARGCCAPVYEVDMYGKPVATKKE